MKLASAQWNFKTPFCVFLALVLAFCLMVTTVPAAEAANNFDRTETQIGKDEIKHLPGDDQFRSLLYPNGTFWRLPFPLANVLQALREIYSMGPVWGNVEPAGHSSSRNYVPKDIMPPFVVRTDPGDGDETVSAKTETVIVYFNEGVETVDTNEDITVTNGADKDNLIEREVRGNTLVIRPVDGFTSGAPVNGIVTVNFSMKLCDAENIPVQITGGGDAKTFYGSTHGYRMVIPYTGLTYGVDYNVSFPSGSVQSSTFGSDNEKIKLSFKAF